MNEYKEWSLSKKVFGPIFLLGLSLICIFAFVGSSGLLLTGIINEDEIIIFGKNSMYTFGIGLLFIPLTIISLITTIKRKIIDVNRTLGKYILMIPMIVLFIFPQVVDYAVSSYMKKISYVYCQEQSIIKLEGSRYAFAKDKETCLKVTKDMFDLSNLWRWNKYFDDKK